MAHPYCSAGWENFLDNIIGEKMLGSKHTIIN